MEDGKTIPHSLKSKRPDILLKITLTQPVCESKILQNAVLTSATTN